MASRVYSANELLGASAACDVLEIGLRTLARRLAAYALTGADADVPPSVMQGKQRRWRYDYLVAFKQGRTSLRGFQDHGYPQGGVVQTSGEPRAHTPLTARALGRMLDGWKVRELHRRYEVIHDPAATTSDLFAAHEAERRLLHDGEGNLRSRDDPGVIEACMTKAREIVQPEGTAYLPQELAPLVRLVWAQVLETERGWLIDRD